MRDGIDATRHAARDDDPRARHAGRERARCVGTVGSVVPAAHDADRRTPEPRDVAPDIQQRGRLGDFGQERREPRIVGNEHRRAQSVELLQDFVPGVRGDRSDGARRRAAEAGQRRDGAGGSVHGGAGALEGGDQRA